MALAAAFLGGRYSEFRKWHPPQTGTWQLLATAGFQQKVPITQLTDEDYLLAFGSSNVLSGKYRWDGRHLVVTDPVDKRFKGLTWQWEGEDLVLVGEPPNHPAGPSYLGARLKYLSPDTSLAYPLRKPQRVQRSP